MKTIYLLFATIAVISTSDAQLATTDAQVSTTEAEETTYSGDGAFTTSEVKNPCDSSPCANGGVCSEVAGRNTYACECKQDFVGETCDLQSPCLRDPCENGGLCIVVGPADDFECKCVSGYSGLTCGDSVQCEGKMVAGNNTIIQPDVACGATVVYTSENNTVNVTFSNATAGTVISSSETCGSCVVPGATWPLATVECQEDGSFGEPKYIDCSAEILSNEELLSTSLAATANPSSINNESATFAIESTSQFISSQTTITSTDASSILYIYNNLLSATDDGAASTVKEQSDTIVATLKSVANKVDLDNTGSGATVGNITGYYVSVQDNFALAVTDYSETELMVFSNGQLGNDGNIKEAGLWLTADTSATGASSTYIKVTQPVTTRAVGDRVSFNIYSSPATLFGDLPNVVSAVLSAYGDGEFTFNFNTPTAQNTEIRKWNQVSLKWETPQEENCLQEPTTDNNARFICQEEGEYAMIYLTTASTGGDDELSTGAIVGIVIGCVVGVALIGGGVYYFAFYAAKKKKKNAIASSHEEMKMDDVEDK